MTEKSSIHDWKVVWLKNQQVHLTDHDSKVVWLKSQRFAIEKLFEKSSGWKVSILRLRSHLIKKWSPPSVNYIWILKARIITHRVLCACTVFFLHCLQFLGIISFYKTLWFYDYVYFVKMHFFAFIGFIPERLQSHKCILNILMWESNDLDDSAL